MLFLIITIIYLSFAFLIIKHKGEKRFLYFLIAVFIVPGNINVIPMSLFTGFMIYSSAFVMSLFYHGEFNARNFKQCPLFNSFMLMVLNCFLIAILDDIQGQIVGLWEGLKFFLSTYFLFFVGWFSINNNNIHRVLNQRNNFLTKLLPATIIITLYGLATFFTRTNPILDAVGLEGRFLFENDESYRSFRVTGPNISAEVYGLACGIYSICSIFWIKKKSKLQIFAIVMLLINMFLAGSRAAMVSIIISLLIYLVAYKGIYKTIKYFIVVIFISTCLYQVMPSSIKDLSSEITTSVISVINPSDIGDEMFVGSNIDGRTLQIMTAMEYLKEHPFFGHGFGYAGKVVMKGGKHDGLLGMESHICFIGVEYGLIYAITLIILFTNCIIYFYKNKKYAPQYAYMGIAFVVMFIFFLSGAWVGEAWYFVMPILGYITAILYTRKKQETGQVALSRERVKQI